MSRLNHAPLLTAILSLALTGCGDRETPPSASPAPSAGGEIAATVAELEQAAFAKEKEARFFENEGIVPLWNRLLNAAPADRLPILADVPFQEFALGLAGPGKPWDFGVQTTPFTAGGKEVDAAGWRALVQAWIAQGYALVHTDWHQESFQRDASGTAHSDIRCKLQATRNAGQGRAEWKGTLAVTWAEADGRPTLARIEVKSGTFSTREGPPAFVRKAEIEGTPRLDKPDQRADMGALCVVDLNGDQLPEILLGNANRILWNRGGFQFEAAPLIPEDGRVFRSVIGLVADLTGDGVLDWLCDTSTGSLALYPGKLDSTFSGNPRRVDLGDYSLKVPSCLTAGDVDLDGDLDIFVGQWRSLYDQMPEKFWDANDGYGNTLLLNDGLGHFTDATAASGLADKRFRRTYSSSFVDLDGDHDLDLVVVSDFHGTDFHLNDGHGHFTGAATEVLGEPHAFGMSHTFGDYNADGILDFFVLGMGSTTARRLEKMQANPERYPEANAMRTIMGYGNRMYLGSATGQFSAPDFKDQVARTGWSWGSTSADFDNDGDTDIYVGNGHISGKSTRDYCTNFWCRDIYVLKEKPTLAISQYLNDLPQMEEQSWDGFQVNPLLVNEEGRGFQDFGFLLDVGFDFDARHVVSADLDLDGRVDLLVDRMQTTSGFFHDAKAPTQPPALLVLQNALEISGRPWIGVTLTDAPAGAVVQVVCDGTPPQTAVFVSGDSFASQHPATKHFGLKPGTAVRELVVTWPGGKTARLADPAVGAYHRVARP